MKLSCDTAIPLLDINPREMKSVCQRNIHISMFIEALFTIAKKWKLPKCSLKDEWTKKM
jgi:hypothetical protein